MSIAPVANVSAKDLERGLDDVRAAPSKSGTLELIAVRPALEQRKIVDSAHVDMEFGVVGDMWAEKPTSKTGEPDPEAQVTLMGARAAALVADSGNHDAWAQAGDQLYVEFDLSEANLPAGTRIAIGEVLLEVSAEPHLGCGKFIKRFGVDAMKLVNSEEGRALRLRGVNAKVVEEGKIRAGDEVRKV
jgi:MOSC domain-containing protein YiiM